MVKIYLDNQAYEVAEGQNLLQACLSLKKDLPYFCWHPAMGSVGACRQCAMTQYQDENDTRGRLIVACMTPVSEGLRVSMNAPAETEFRDQVISALMTHHPHDCPVCAEGGECHLQDMTVMSGHHNRQFKGKKTTFPNQELGPLIKHEMNRCITCYRCERFYRDYAGGEDLAAQASKNHVYFGRQCDGTLESEFAGNLVEVCPTGVFTDKPFGDHYSRKWDLQAAPSICQHCSVGCNISLSERYGSVRRVTNRLNDHLNGYFLCDRGRFGFGFVNSAERSEEIHIKGSATDWANPQLQSCLQEPGRWVGIGSSQASLEDNFALQQLVGKENFCVTLDPKTEALLQMNVNILRQWRMPSLAQMEQADAILIVGEDINASAPRMALAIRQALLNKAKEKAEALRVPQWQDAAVRQILPHNPVPLAVLGSGHSALAQQAHIRLVGDDKKVAEQSFLLANLLNNSAPKPRASKIDNEILQLVQILQNAKRPLIVTGWTANNPALLAAAANIGKALKNPQTMLAIAPPDANIMGLGLLAQHGHYSIETLRQDLQKGVRPNLIALDHSDADFNEQLDALRDQCQQLVRLSQLNAQPRDSVDLPITSFSECSGSVVNYQGRVQAFMPASKPPEQCLPAWQWLVNIARLRKHPFGQIEHMGQLREWITDQYPHLLGTWAQDSAPQIAMQPPRYSGRTAMLANQTVHEPKPFGEDNAPYKQSMEGVMAGSSQGAAMPYSWSPGWNSNQSNHKFKDEYRGVNTEAQPGVDGIQAKYERCWFKWQQAWSASPDGKWKILRKRRVFGSDSLSLHAVSIQQMLQPPQISLNAKSAAELGLEPDQVVQVEATDTLFSVEVDDSIAANTLMLYLPANQSFPLQACDNIKAVSKKRANEFYQHHQQTLDQVAHHRHTETGRLLAQDQTIPIRFIEGIQ